MEEIMKAVRSSNGEMPHRSFVEAQVLEAIGIDFVDESEVLTPQMRAIMSGNMILKCLLFVVP